MTRLLLVEDEEAYVDALVVSLESEGFEVTAARDGAEALELFFALEPDIVLLDLMIPKVNGLDVCREIRTRSQVPIIMVTAKSSESDTVEGLQIGADDYITKPYRIRELVARIHSVLRRSSGADFQEEVISAGGIEIDRSRHEVRLNGVVVAFPLMEFKVLEQLVADPGRVLTRGVLIERVWGSDYVGDTKTLDVHIKRIRSKVESDPRNPTLICTVRGVGYKLIVD